MRQDILDFISGLSLGGFAVSQELPWDDSGTALYLKNVKRIYVDTTQYATQPLITTLDGLSINQDVSTVGLYFSADAKQLPANYDTLVSDLRSAKDVALTDASYRRECDVSTEFSNDLIVTQLEYRFTKLS